ncbi:phosphatase [Nitrospira sp.]|nr:phosphatase [Nitrospira sp.]
MASKFMKVLLTEPVRRAQQDTYGRCLAIGNAPASDVLTEDEVQFIAARDSLYLATVNEDGWPYIQHRGGPPGFVQALDARTLAFADYRGNRQLLTAGHLRANDKVALFLMDYPNQTRLKVIGYAHSETAASHESLLTYLPAAERRLVERVIVITVVGFDWNCPQHITPRYTAEQVENYIAPPHARIAELERQLPATVLNPGP